MGEMSRVCSGEGEKGRFVGLVRRRRRNVKKSRKVSTVLATHVRELGRFDIITPPLF